MKATVIKTDLLRGIQTAERAASTKSSLPILAALLLTVQDDILRVKATDLEVSISTSVAVTDAEDGGAAVLAKQFVDYIRAMPGASVSLVVEKGTMSVKCGKSRFKLQVLGSSEEFPLLAPVESDASFTVNEKALSEALDRTLVAAATEDTRPTLCGVLWQLRDNAESLPMVATDTHRLHMAACPITSAVGTMDILVSGRTCQEAARLLGADEDCVITIDKNQVQIDTAAGTLVGRRIEGQFPKYEKVVPDYTHFLAMNRDDLAEVVKRAGIVAKDASGRIRLTFAEGRPLEITADAGDKGTAEEEIEITGNLKPDQDLAIAANWAFFLAAVQACPDEALRFLHQGALRPVLLHGVDRSQFFAVIMPMTVS